MPGRATNSWAWSGAELSGESNPQRRHRSGHRIGLFRGMCIRIDTLSFSGVPPEAGPM